MAHADLPTGTVTFLFSDIEGSTRLVSALGSAFPAILERHQALLREAFRAHDGVEIATEGDSFFVVFRAAPAAIDGALAAQRALAAEEWPAPVDAIRVRIGLHTGDGVRGGDNYVGLDVHRAARIAAAAHGGQVLLSEATAALARGALPVGVTLRDLGAHRLKDLERPEGLYQLVAPDLPADFPPPRTLETPTNLPPQVTSFVGREREAAEVRALLAGTRLLTLTGPGGTGKTRLSLRVASDVRADYPGGTWFVELAPITDPALIPSTIALAIGVREEPSRSVLDSLTEYLAGRRVLLVLDNFEQLVAGAAVVGRLLAALPELTVLTSSREVLHLRGEHEYPVPPLADIEATALFVQRAQAVRPDFSMTDANASAVRAICARLDGLPLAIELAAARVKLFAPDAILGRLEKRLSLLVGGARDLPARQQTLRGAIDWSHDLLDPIERTLFRRLAVFQGGCTFETAAAICDPDGDLGIDVLDGLPSLLDKSLLRAEEGSGGEPRFRMLETIREYARDRLAEAPDGAATWQRHGEYFADLAARAEPLLLRADQGVWLERLEVERDNLRAAIHWAADHGRVELALTTAGNLWRFWHQRAHLAEGREELAGLLARPGGQGATRGRAKALSGLGGVAYWQGRYDDATAAYREAVAIVRQLDDPAELADALYNLAFVDMIRDRRPAARPLFAESLALYERLGDVSGTTKVREALAFLLYLEGDPAGALELEDANIAVFRRLNEPFRIGNAVTLAGLFRVILGDFEPARQNLIEAMRIFRAAGDMPTIVNCLLLGAFALVRRGETETAAEVLGTVAALREPLGELATALDILSIDDPSIEARRRLGDDAYEAALARGRLLDLDAAEALAFRPLSARLDADVEDRLETARGRAGG